MLFALFGIESDGLNVVVNLLVLALVVTYFALVAWTYFDARRRMEDSVLVSTSVMASLIFPFVGTVIYSILRPPEFLEDARERELEVRAAELRVRQLSTQACPSCEYPIERSFLRCPNCETRLKDPCPSCSKPLDPRWSMCPYCETPVPRRQPGKRRPARQRERRPAPARPAAQKGRAPPPQRGRRVPAGGRPAAESAGDAKPAAGGDRAPERRGGEQPPGEERSRPATAS